MQGAHCQNVLGCVVAPPQAGPAFGPSRQTCRNREPLKLPAQRSAASRWATAPHRWGLLPSPSSAPPQIQMKCLGMRQSIIQSTPSPHEVRRRHAHAAVTDRGRRRSGLGGEGETEREGGHSRIRSCAAGAWAEKEKGRRRSTRGHGTGGSSLQIPPC